MAHQSNMHPESGVLITVFYENCDKDKNYYCKKKKPFILEAIRNDFNRFESIQMGFIWKASQDFLQ